MKKLPIICLILLLALTGWSQKKASPKIKTTLPAEPSAVEKAVSQFAKYKPEEQPKIMLLGSFHFAEYQGDKSGNTFTANPPDVMSEQRQKELQELRNLIAKFRPTKICVEWKQYHQAKLSEQYKNATDLSKLQRNEIHQIAFKLGKELGHADLYAVDTDNRWYMDSVAAYAFSHNQGAMLMKAQQIMPGWLADHYKSMESKTMTQVFLEMNQHNYLRFAHATHLEMSTIGASDNYIGAELYLEWMKRNTKIFSNINWITEPNDRILVLYGASHVHSLKEMFRDSFNYEVVELGEL
jgi:hypothetical protein